VRLKLNKWLAKVYATILKKKNNSQSYTKFKYTNQESIKKTGNQTTYQKKFRFSLIFLASLKKYRFRIFVSIK